MTGKVDVSGFDTFRTLAIAPMMQLKGDPDNVEKHLVSYIKGFSRNVRDIFDFFEFENEIERMREANILYLVVSKFCDVNLHPDTVPNEQMGLLFENLIRRFNELANETAGDHFTPREVIRLMVSILFIHDDNLLATPGTVRKLLDPACGTGGMLAEAQNYLREHHGAARLYVYGQDYNKRAFATAASDMLMKQVDHNGGGDNVRYGDSFTEDQFHGQNFDYFLTNPPFGVDWKKQQKEIQQEHDKRGFDGRFGAGLPRVNDGSLLFLQHMWDKREPVRPAEHQHGSRLAIVFSGSPLFTGGAGSGESNIRKWIIENDWLEAIIALPEQMFYNTGIGTYIWIVTNRKEKRRKGKIQLLDARDVWTAGGSEDVLHLRKSRWKATEQKLFRSVCTQKDPEAEPVAAGGRDNGYEPDADLRDFENVPLKNDIDTYFEREVRPHVPDAWMDREKDKIGYEINFNRYFYKYTLPRPLEEIDVELKQAEAEITLLRESRAIVTFDTDFSDIRTFPPSAYSGLVVFRLDSQARDHVLEIGTRFLRALSNATLDSQLWIVEESRIRMRE